MLKEIRRALISVTDKEGIVELVKFLANYNIEVISTGSTAKYLEEASLSVRALSDYTEFPEILDGRVKTLHPRIHGGILATDHSSHLKTMEQHKIESIDLIIVNLYQFAQAMKENLKTEECIEHIDIGGPSLIRAAAKNMQYKTVITDPRDYSLLMAELIKNEGATSYEFRCKQAQKAFMLTAHYDSIVAGWFASLNKDQFPDIINISAVRKQKLRYGENSHQKASLYVLSYNKENTILNSNQIQGKELSYNNILDADAAINLIREFTDPTAVIIKHNNPCGVATGNNILTAYNNALASDRNSAFGGIIALNRPVTKDLALELNKLFIEVIVAPQIEEEAQIILSSKQNLRILTMKIEHVVQPFYQFRSVDGGVLVQEYDNLEINMDNFQVVTKRQPTNKELEDLLFALRVCKHVKSNAIVIATNQATVGIGAGQMSRIDSVKIALLKATDNLGFNAINKTVLASDAFFPFSDSIMASADAGIKAIIQPGGSIRDQDVIKAADERDISMVFTNIRYFKH